MCVCVCAVMRTTSRHPNVFPRLATPTTAAPGDRAVAMSSPGYKRSWREVQARDGETAEHDQLQTMGEGFEY